MILIGPELGWTIAGVIVAGIFGLLSIWNPFKRKPEQVELGPETLEIVKKDLRNLTDPTVQVNYFPHASLQAAIELTNLGTVGITISNVIISTDLFEHAPTEMYSLSAAILPRERQLISVYSPARKYFDAHMSVRYKTGMESRRPSIRASFRCDVPSGHFDTKWLTLVGRLSNATLVDLKPLDGP